MPLRVASSCRASPNVRPLAFPIDTAPKAEELVFVYSPLRGEWTIGVLPLVAGPTNCMLATI